MPTILQSVSRITLNGFGTRAFGSNVPTLTTRIGNQLASSKLCTRRMSTVNLKASEMKIRRGARVLLIDPQQRVLIFEYSHKQNDALRDKGSYFTIPGGKARDTETFAQCAERELREETGLNLPLGPVVATRQAPMLQSSGEYQLATEEYFAIHVKADQVYDTSNWTAQEKRNIKALHWYTASQLAGVRNLWPSTLVQIMENVSRDGSALNFKSTKEQIGDVTVLVQY